MLRKPVGMATLAVLLASAGPARAATHTWPGAAPCAGSLQACIDGSGDGDRIEVAADTIDEDIVIYDVDRILVAAAGHNPAFGPGHWLSITSSAISGDRNVTLDGLSFTDGYVYVNYRGTGTATYDLGHLSLKRELSDTSNYIRIGAESGTVNAYVHENRLSGLPRDTLAGMIELKAIGGTLNADAYYNRVESESTALVPGAGIFADYAGSGSGGRVRAHGNQVRGAFSLGAIIASEGLGSSTAVAFDARAYNNVVVGTDAADSQGIRFLVNTGTIHANAIANTVTRTGWGIIAGPYSGAAAGARIDGVFSSNLVRANVGLFIDAAHAPSLTNDYNLLNAAANLATPGTHTITTDARVVSDDAPRLRADSPAIDAADTTTVGLGILLNGLPFLDADGLRRMKTWVSPDKIDIGAYEFGDASFAHVATAANTSGNVTYLDDPSVNGVATAHLQVTQNYALRGVEGTNPIGTWLNGSSWSVFTQNIVAPPAGLGFDVFSPAPGTGAFRHVADAPGITGEVTRLNDDSVNNNPDSMLFVTQDYGASGPYNAHDVGVRYVATSPTAGYWTIANLDRSAMPAGAGFSVYAQASGPNAFRVTKALTGGSAALPIDHPLLNGNRCAQPIVTRLYTGSAVSGGHYDVFFNNGTRRWGIYSYESGGIPLDTAFNVLVNPAQVAACTDVIFANGLD